MEHSFRIGEWSNVRSAGCLAKNVSGRGVKTLEVTKACGDKRNSQNTNRL